MTVPGKRATQQARGLAATVHRRTLANSVWALANRAVSGVALLSAQALFARALQPSEVGLYYLAAFVGTAAATLGTLGLPSAATRFVAAEMGAGHSRAPAVARRILAAAAGALTFVLAVLAVALALGPASWRPVAPAVLVAYAGATGARLVLAGLAQGFADFRGQLAASLGAALVLPAGALWVFTQGGDASVALAITAAHAAAGAALLGLRTRSRLAGAAVGPALDGATRRRMSRYALGVSAMLVLDAIVWQQSELLFLRAFSSQAEVGFYAVSFTLVAQAMQFLPGSAGVALFPALAHAAGSGDRAALQRVYHGAVRLLAALALPAGLVGAAMAPVLLRVLYGQAFAPASPAARVLWLSGAIGALGIGPASVLYALERQRAMVIASLPVAALNLALDLVLIPRHGALGAALANGAAQAAGVCVMVTLARREVGPLPWSSLLRTGAASLAAAGAAWLAAAGGTGLAALARAGVAAAVVGLGALALLGELRHLPFGELRWSPRGESPR
jgi:O-antigen/teichoic acid export membrane protein